MVLIKHRNKPGSRKKRVPFPQTFPQVIFGLLVHQESHRRGRSGTHGGPAAGRGRCGSPAGLRGAGLGSRRVRLGEAGRWCAPLRPAPPSRAGPLAARPLSTPPAPRRRGARAARAARRSPRPGLRRRPRRRFSLSGRGGRRGGCCGRGAPRRPVGGSGRRHRGRCALGAGAAAWAVPARGERGARAGVGGRRGPGWGAGSARGGVPAPSACATSAGFSRQVCRPRFADLLGGSAESRPVAK